MYYIIVSYTCVVPLLCHSAVHALCIQKIALALLVAAFRCCSPSSNRLVLWARVFFFLSFFRFSIVFFSFTWAFFSCPFVSTWAGGKTGPELFLSVFLFSFSLSSSIDDDYSHKSLASSSSLPSNKLKRNRKKTNKNTPLEI